MQHDTNSPLKIIVVGGGIAGLAIAHSLERAKRSSAVSDVTVVVFESRTEESSFQKYPINLSAPGRAALSAILSPESLQQLEQRSYTLDGGISTFTETLSHLFTFKRRADERRLFVHRWILHEALLEGVDIRRGKRVVRVKDDREDGAGKVEVVFHDGTVERGDLVIAADGIGSVIRSQLHPRHAKFPELPYLTVQFKLLTPPERLPIALSDSRAKMILGKNGTCLLLAPLPGSTVPALPHTDLNPFSDPSDVRPTLDALNEPTPGYIFAVFGCKVFPGWEDMSGQSWLGTIAKTLERDGTHPHIVKAIADDGVPQTVGAWRTLSADPKDPVPWRDGRVVLCGDAVHVMPSIAGAGGATALEDAEHLVNTLLSSCELGGSDGPLDALLPTFHAEMMNRAHGHIRDAHRKLAFSHQEGWGVYWRRALMRIMGLIWPLANWMLNKGQEAAAKATESSEEQRRKVL